MPGAHTAKARDSYLKLANHIEGMTEDVERSEEKLKGVLQWLSTPTAVQ